jgi:hypothetical protein
MNQFFRDAFAVQANDQTSTVSPKLIRSFINLVAFPQAAVGTFAGAERRHVLFTLCWIDVASEETVLLYIPDPKTPIFGLDLLYSGRSS